MGAIIAEVINWRDIKLSTYLPFPCLITRPCREVHIPILAGIGVESAETSYAMPQPSQCALTQNFDRVVRKGDKQEKQLKLFAEQLGIFVDRAITGTLEPYKNLHACIYDMEARVIDRLKDLTVPDLLRVEEEMRIEEMRARVGGASSSSAPRVEGHVTRATVSLESQTLVTLSPATGDAHKIL
ncbi:hypothetical protein HAX54_052766 [Datura stramonium]|uniref:Uncharacterized protein n=1 Tax=Datura stramonium TaxID=4076 RepID=A0ABS8WR18_DATST|nr:hypothetical protein [Datura stramonium]